MRAATRERTISIMAEAGLAGGLWPTESYPETGLGEMPNRASGIVGGSDITFRRHRRVVINLSVRLASFIIEIVLLNDLLSALTLLSTLVLPTKQYP